MQVLRTRLWLPRVSVKGRGKLKDVFLGEGEAHIVIIKFHNGKERVL